MKTKHIILGISALAVMALPSLSHAQSMTMGGSVTATCTFAFTGGTTSIALDLVGGTVSSTTFDVDCNTPSDVSYTSRDGYLKLITTNPANDSVSETDLSSAASPNFDAGVDYIIDIRGFLPINTSALTANTASIINANAGATTQTGVTMNFTPVAGQPLLGGTYADLFTVTVTPLAI